MTDTVQAVACGHATNSVKSPCDHNPGHLGEHANVEGERWYNHGPVDVYEITWTSGHVETVVAHQVTYPHAGLALFSGGGSLATETQSLPPTVRFHAEINGRWVQTLSAREEDIRTMRLVTGGEQIPGGER